MWWPPQCDQLIRVTQICTYAFSVLLSRQEAKSHSEVNQRFIGIHWRIRETISRAKVDVMIIVSDRAPNRILSQEIIHNIPNKAFANYRLDSQVWRIYLAGIIR